MISNKVLYERIMFNISKEIAHALNEFDTLSFDFGDFLDDDDDIMGNNEIYQYAGDIINIEDSFIKSEKEATISNVLYYTSQFILFTSSKSFNFKKDFNLASKKLRDIFNNVLKKYFSKYSDKPDLIDCWKYYHNIYNENKKYQDAKYNLLEELTYIMVWAPKIYEQLKNHPNMKYIFESEEYLPTCYFEDFSQCTYHPKNIDEADALFTFFMNIRFKGIINKSKSVNPDNKYDTLDFIDKIDFSYIISDTRTYYQTLFALIHYLPKQISEYNGLDNTQLLNKCIEFGKKYPNLWNEILDDIINNGSSSNYIRECNFYSLSNIIRDYKKYLFFKYNDLFKNLFKKYPVKVNIEREKTFVEKVKSFPVIHTQNDISKLNPNDFRGIHYKWYDEYAILFNIDLYDIFPDCEFEQNIIPVKVTRREIPDWGNKWRIDYVDAVSSSYYGALFGYMFSLNFGDVWGKNYKNAKKKLNKALSIYLKKIKTYLINNKAYGATTNKIKIKETDDQYKDIQEYMVQFDCHDDDLID